MLDVVVPVAACLFVQKQGKVASQFLMAGGILPLERCIQHVVLCRQSADVLTLTVGNVIVRYISVAVTSGCRRNYQNLPKNRNEASDAKHQRCQHLTPYNPHGGCHTTYVFSATVEVMGGQGKGRGRVTGVSQGSRMEGSTSRCRRWSRAHFLNVCCTLID